MFRRAITTLFTVLALALAMGGSALAAHPYAEPVKYNPFTDTRPAQAAVDPAIRETDPVRNRELAAALPPRHDSRISFQKEHGSFSAFASYNVGGGTELTSAADHGFVFSTSVLGGLSLSKPNTGVSTTVYAPLVQAYKSCLRVGFQHYSPIGTTTTYHYMVVADDCNATQTNYTINATTWGNYTTTQNTLSLTDPGVTIADKTSVVRVYEDNTSTNHWSVDVWSYAINGYVNFASHSGDASGGGSSIFEFKHMGDTTVNGSYCNSLGTWNVANLANTSKWNGSSFSVVTSGDVNADFVDNGEPCFNSGTGNSNWYITNAINGGGLFYQVCGPTSAACRP